MFKVIFSLVPLTAICGVFGQSPVGAQEPWKPEQVYNRVFTTTTGQNGYEEIVAAVDLLRADRQLNEQVGQVEQLSLTDQRKIANSKTAMKIRQLVREGIRKGVKSPRVKFDELTVFPELAGIRAIARLWNLEMRVAFADGRVSFALEILRDGLRLGHAISTDSLITGLVGIAVDAIVVKRAGLHVDQWSATDCDRIVTLVREWLNLPDPTQTVLKAERDGMMNIFQKYRNNPTGLVGALMNPSDDPKEEEQRQQALKLASDNPQAATQIIDRATQRSAEYYDQVLVAAREPFYKRSLPKLDDTSTPDGRLVGMLMPSVSSVLDRYAKEEAQLKMLACYAAVKRHWWEHNLVPGGLRELRLGAIAVDPFTGKDFIVRKFADGSFVIETPGSGEKGSVSTVGFTFPVKS